MSVFLINITPLFIPYWSVHTLWSCPLSNLIEYSSLHSSVHAILQASVLEWVAMPSSRGSSRPRDQTHVSYVSCVGWWVLYHWCHLGNP